MLDKTVTNMHNVDGPLRFLDDMNTNQLLKLLVTRGNELVATPEFGDHYKWSHLPLEQYEKDTIQSFFNNSENQN